VESSRAQSSSDKAQNEPLKGDVVERMDAGAAYYQNRGEGRVISSPWVARAILVAMAGLLAAAAYLGRAPVITGTVKPGEFSDNDMHRIVADRVRAGESYYDALGAELRRSGYATKPFFHWRLPTLLWTMGKLPLAAAGKGILVAITAIMIFVWANRLRPSVGFSLTCVAVLVLTPSLVLAVLTNWYLQHELWAGVLIALSLGLHDGRHTKAGILSGLAALAIRELALAYVLIMCVAAAYERKTKEAIAWAAGIVAFAVFLGIHASIVFPRQMTADLSDPSWLRFAGWPFVTACSSWMFWSLIPYWLAAMLAVLGVFGLAASRRFRMLATVAIYMAAFSVVGKPFDDYWGLMYAPLLAIGLVYSGPAIRDLAASALPLTGRGK